MKDLLPKPSDALTAMIDGLRHYSEQPHFSIDMDTFGVEVALTGRCYGCAATCATLNVRPECPVTFHLRYQNEGVEDFETMIDSLRRGHTDALAEYYDVDLPDEKLPYLSNDNWQDNLPFYEQYRDNLLSIGQ